MQTETAARRPRTAPKAARRRQLIEATVATIAERGLSGATMAEVTARAGTSLGLANFHFRTKETLLLETLAFLAREHRDVWARRLDDETLTPAARLSALMSAHFHPATCNPRRIAVWFAFFGEERWRRAYREIAASFDRERAEVVETLCRAVIEEGGYAGLDAAATAQSLECFADGLWLNVMMYPDWLSRADAEARMRGFLDGVFPRHCVARPAEETVA